MGGATVTSTHVMRTLVGGNEMQPTSGVYKTGYGLAERVCAGWAGGTGRFAWVEFVALTQAAICEELERTSLPAWLDSLPTVSRLVDHDAATAALDDVHDEFGG